jgi:hypothetical protein
MHTYMYVFVYVYVDSRVSHTPILMVTGFPLLQHFSYHGYPFAMAGVCAVRTGYVTAQSMPGVTG